MRPDDFDFIAQILKKRSGLVISNDKLYLLESRLLPVARRRGIQSMDELVSSIRLRPDETLLRDITEAMTTNESFFFRDTRPFDQFRNFTLPELLKSRASQKRIRIWCAAASTGQEPYSIAMILKEEAYKLSGWKVEILATDLSREVLERARLGIYNQFEVQRGLPTAMLNKYFTKVKDDWQINAEIRSMVTYKEFNLLNNMIGLGKFDVIFCRNVLIYFDQETKGMVLDNMAKLLPEDGFLYLGGTETILGISESFKQTSGQRSIYSTTGK
jgi:chemotaxis protein methyltransferase CheR